MYKFGRNGKPGLRLVRVSSNYQELQWTSKRKKPRDSRILNIIRSFSLTYDIHLGVQVVSCLAPSPFDALTLLCVRT